MNIKALLLKPLRFFLIFRALKEACSPQPVAEMRKEALDQARRDLHAAELTFERARAELAMLRGRVKRLGREVELVIHGDVTLHGDVTPIGIRIKNTLAAERHAMGSGATGAPP